MINYNNAQPVIDDDHTWYTDKKLETIKQIRILRTGSGDWTGLYVDGELRREGHSLDVMHAIMDVLGSSADIKNVTIKDNYLDDYGARCPITWPNELEVALNKRK
jgi:hypothetical protein